MKKGLKWKTREEMLAEANKLKEIKPRVLQFTAFGDDNHAAIDAQIRALEEDLGDQDVEDLTQYDDEEPDESKEFTMHQRDSAIEALNWAAGEEKTPPSESWSVLIKS